jgi:hypothetical protein
VADIEGQTVMMVVSFSLAGLTPAIGCIILRLVRIGSKGRRARER